MMDTKQILQEVDLIGDALNIICQRSNFQSKTDRIDDALLLEIIESAGRLKEMLTAEQAS